MAQDPEQRLPTIVSAADIDPLLKAARAADEDVRAVAAQSNPALKANALHKRRVCTNLSSRVKLSTTHRPGGSRAVSYLYTTELERKALTQAYESRRQRAPRWGRFVTGLVSIARSIPPALSPVMQPVELSEPQPGALPDNVTPLRRLGHSARNYSEPPGV